MCWAVGRRTDKDRPIPVIHRAWADGTGGRRLGCESWFSKVSARGSRLVLFWMHVSRTPGSIAIMFRKCMINKVKIRFINLIRLLFKV